MADAGNRGAVGTMFYLRALRDVVVTSFDFYASAINTDLVQVYTRPGTYTGFELSSDGWRLVYDNPSLSQLGRNAPTSLGDFNTGVPIPAGSFQSFFIYSPNKLMYKAGTTEGSRFSIDNMMEFYEGVGVTAFFSGNPADIYSPRVVTGAIRYDFKVHVE